VSDAKPRHDPHGRVHAADHSGEVGIAHEIELRQCLFREPVCGRRDWDAAMDPVARCQNV
jgi:hypothetical protein